MVFVLDMIFLYFFEKVYGIYFMFVVVRFLLNYFVYLKYSKEVFFCKNLKFKLNL